MDCFLYNNGLRHGRVNLRQNSQFSRTPINTVHHGIESISNFGSKIWDLVPSNLKEISDLDKFKKVTKQCKSDDCL